jgi:hypothetical protein
MINNNFYTTDNTGQTKTTKTQFCINNYIIENWDKAENEFLDGKKAMLISDLKKSGLSPKTVKSAGLEIFRGSVDDLKELIGFSSIQGQSLTQACTMLKIPYYNASGNEIYCRIRLYPQINDAKYIGKAGHPAIPYIPQSVYEIKDKKNVEIWITEGEKKALKLVQEGEKAIAIGGVWNFKAGKDSDETANNKELWREIYEFIIPGRTFYLAFDMDLSKNSAIRQAMFQLALVLYNRNINVRITKWDTNLKGIDDYLTSEEADIQMVKEKALGILEYIEKNPEYSQEALSVLKNINFNDIAKNKLQAAFKKIGILKKDFERYLKHNHSESAEPVILDDGFILPSGFLKFNGKLCALAENEFGMQVGIPICPFFVVEKITRVSENTLLSLNFDNSAIEEIDAVCIGDGRELCKEFNEKGIFITPPDARNISVYLKKFIDINDDKILKIKSYSKTGWHSDDEFFAPTVCDPKNILFDLDIQRKIVVKGQSDKQVEFLKKVFAEHIGSSVIICAGLAATLIKPLSLNNYVFFTSGRTGTGKTLANQLMLSLFGDPETLKNNMNSTSVGVEILFSRLSDMPVLLDELETAGINAEKINNFLINLIYSFQSGVGRIRSQKNLQLRHTAIYRGILFLTSERSIKSILGDNTSQKANLGIYRRVIELNDKIPLFADMVKYADIANEINKNYGHILPLWILFVKENLDKIKADFLEIRDYKLNINLGGKHEAIFLLKITYNYFCKMLNIKTNDNFNNVLMEIVSENAEMFNDEVLNEYEKYINAIKEFAVSSGRFFNKIQEKTDGNNYRKPLSGIIGQIETSNDDCILYFYTNKAIETLCKEYKFEQKRLIESLKEKEILISSDLKGKFTTQKKIDGNPLRCYCFKVS